MRDFCALILAAGKGTRMKSERAKVLHTLCGKPMLRMVYDAVAALQPEEIIVVIGQDADRVRELLDGCRATFVTQAQQLGTGHAVMAARQELAKRKGSVLILFGDAPRIRTETLRRLAEHHQASNADMTLLTVQAADPFGYGRIIRDNAGRVRGIVEEKDAAESQKKITEVNPSFYCIRISSLLAALDQIRNQNAQKEYYLTDMLEIQVRSGAKVESVEHDDFEELRGINSRAELAQLAAALRAEKNRALMAAGVTLLDPERTYIDLDVEIAKDVTVYPAVTLQGSTRIGEGSAIHSGTRIADSRIGAGVAVLDCCLITESTVGDGATIGPFAHLRKQSAIGSHCRVGNFVEVKKSCLGAGTKAAHLAYLGDAEIGAEVNIGAGTITCNYDGVRKHPTIIEDGAFIGTASQLVAPVRVGKGAYVAAGSCITEDVPPESLAIARSRQTVKEGWVRRRKAPK